MSRFFSRRQKSRPQGCVPSPGYLLEWAAMLTVLFIVAHLVGLREFTSVLNGTIGSTNLSWQTASFLGVVYIFLYLGFVILAPILVLAAAMLKLWQKAMARRSVRDDSRANTKTD